jgi:hypothetical protein
MSTTAPEPRPRERFAVHSPGEAIEAFATLATLDRSQVLALLLDAEHTGATCVAVDDIPEPDGVLRVASLLAELAGHDIGLVAVALASVRPGGGAELADIDRFEQLSDCFEASGVTLLDWFVLGEHSAVGVGELVGAPWRWRGPDPAAGDRLPDGRRPPARSVARHRRSR